ncbi:hypothetical protein SAMN05421854_102474 [Amycolatopsis rubida]|uniref:Uncharacterized protein n=1 Tax=Amycolatopsis rubida TaxID=112413 RepID=A0A1I5IHG3_9PSEU|nr:hypothetical protein SAMN05421854_102474 [Amycolatopsis rubida]
MSEDTPTPTCSKCGTATAGPGGILCPDCRTAIEALIVK